MIIAATGTLQAGKDASLLYRGAYDRMLREMREDGFEAAELHILDSEETDRERLWEALDRYNIRLTSIGTGSAYGMRGLNLVDTDRGVREKTIDHLEAHMKTLAPLHGMVIVGLIAGRNKDARCSLEEQKTRLGESLLELNERARQYQVGIALEMMNRYECDFLHTLEEGTGFLKSLGNPDHVFLHADTVSMNISETDIGAAIRRCGERIGHVHLADNDRWYPGHGHYDFKETLQALYDSGYDGALALEMKPFPDVHKAARLSLDYVKALQAVIMAEKGRE